MSKYKNPKTKQYREPVEQRISDGDKHTISHMLREKLPLRYIESMFDLSPHDLMRLRADMRIRGQHP